ncbi:hypothetical protein JNK13_03855 [bacterium]|nr:hypothetical protein [bacterium]
MTDELPKIPTEEALSPRGRKLRELLSDFEKRSGYNLVGLFDLWCSYESKTNRQELWYIGVAHAVRELLEAFYPGKRTDIYVEKKIVVEESFPEIKVPDELAAKFVVNSEEKSLEWKGIISLEILEKIQGLSKSFVYKYACWLLYSEVKEASNKEKIESVLNKIDPLGNNQARRDAFVKKYTDIQRYFTNVCHCKGLIGDVLKEWDDKVQQVEDLVAGIIEEQSSVIAKVEAFIKQEKPSVEALRKLDVLLQWTASFNYFMDRIDATWIEPLAEAGWFAPLPQLIREKDRITSCAWAASRYLIRVANDVPDKVFKVISEFSFTNNSDPWVLRDTLECLKSIAKKLDVASMLKKLVKDKWLQFDIAHTISMEAVELWQLLVRSGQYKNAGILLEGLLDFDQDLDDPDGRCRPYLDEYYLRKVLDELQNVQPTIDLSFIINALTRKLDAVIKARETKYDETSKEIRIRAFQLYTHEKLIQPTLELCIKKYCSCPRAEGTKPLIQELNAFLASISEDEERDCLRACVVMDNRTSLQGEVQKLLLGDALYSIKIGKEISKRLPEIFSELIEAERSEFLAKVENGNPDYKDNQEVADYWKSKYIRKIWRHLTDDQKNRLIRFQPKDTSDISDDDEVSTTWRGPTSPVSQDQLKVTSVEDAVEYFKTWKPEKEWFGDSMAGLARTLGEVVSQDPIKFIEHADKFFDTKIDPTYLCHFISGVRQAIRNKEKFDIIPMILLSSKICEAANINTLPELSKREVLSVGWAGVLQAIAELFESIFSFNLLPYSDEILPKLMAALSVVSQFPDPSEENLNFYKEHNTEPSHVALNTTQGWGYRACISFLLWLKRNKSTKLSEYVAQITKQIIQRGKSDFWVSYIAGEFLPWIYDLDRSAGKSIIIEILSSNDSVCALAAWDGYVRGRFWKPVYIELEPSLDNFLTKLSRFTPPWKDRHNVVHDIGDRIAVAYLFRWTTQADQKLQLYFDTQDSSARAGIVSFVGTTFLQKRDTDEPQGDIPPIDRLLEFWDWRLSTSSDVQELKEFGWWVVDGYLPRKDMLDRLILTLKKTSGQIEPLMRVSEVLIEGFEQYRLEVLEALLLIVEGGDVQRIVIEYRDGNLKPLIVAGEVSSDPKVKSLANKLKNALLRFGMNSYL